MKRILTVLAAAAVASAVAPFALASSHREAPDHGPRPHRRHHRRLRLPSDYSADEQPNQTPNTVTLIDVLRPAAQEPGNGPTLFPFDPDVTYSLKVDNNRDAVPDVTFELKFTTEFRAPGVPVALIGVGAQRRDRTPRPAAAADPAAGHDLRRRRLQPPPELHRHDGQERQHPHRPGLRRRQPPLRRARPTSGRAPSITPPCSTRASRPLSNGVKVFAGTTDDPFFIDLGRGLSTPSTSAPSAAAPPASRRRVGKLGQPELRQRHRQRLRRQLHRPAGADRDADQHRQRRARHERRGRHRRLRHDRPPARAPSAAARCRTSTRPPTTARSSGWPTR